MGELFVITIFSNFLATIVDSDDLATGEWIYHVHSIIICTRISEYDGS